MKKKIIYIGIISMFLFTAISSLYATAQQTGKEFKENHFVSCAAVPDLIVSTQVALSKYTPYGYATVTIYWSVENIGDASSPYIHVGFYGSIDGAMSYPQSVPALAPHGGFCNLPPYDYVLPAGVRPLYLRVTGEVDPLKEVWEGPCGDNNNIDDKTWTVNSKSCVNNIFMTRFMQQFPMIFKLLQK